MAWPNKVAEGLDDGQGIDDVTIEVQGMELRGGGQR